MKQTLYRSVAVHYTRNFSPASDVYTRRLDNGARAPYTASLSSSYERYQTNTVPRNRNMNADGARRTELLLNVRSPAGTGAPRIRSHRRRRRRRRQ